MNDEKNLEGESSDSVSLEGDDFVSKDVEDAAQLIEFMASRLVDEPDEVKVDVVEDDNKMIYELSVAKDDLGKVIGREGRTARAMRQILTASTGSLKKRSVLDIVD